jgi:hypothetical protein
MKYIANPVEVDAYRIIFIGDSDKTGIPVVLDYGEGQENHSVYATPEMTSRMKPNVGDYWVVQSDGYTYLNPKDVFERKYRPDVPRKRPTIEELQAILDSTDDRPVIINPDGSITVAP